MPFGETRTISGTTQISEIDFGYTGQRDYGGDFGLMDYRSRFLSTRLGRFTQPDTFVPSPSNPQAYNRYAYAYNNPILYSDPSGHSPYWCQYAGDGRAQEACVRRYYYLLKYGSPVDNTVRIRSLSGGVSSPAQGTRIGQNVYLTTDHWECCGGVQPGDADNVSIVDSQGNGGYNNVSAINSHHFPEEDMQLIEATNPNIGAGTATLAPPEVVDNLAVGDWVAIAYWIGDPQGNQFEWAMFEIIEIRDDGQIVIADPNHLLKQGDSGAGVYVDGEVVGVYQGGNAKPEVATRYPGETDVGFFFRIPSAIHNSPLLRKNTNIY